MEGEDGEEEEEDELDKHEEDKDEVGEEEEEVVNTLGVVPQNLPGILQEIRGAIKPSHVVISLVTAATTDVIRSALVRPK